MGGMKKISIVLAVFLLMTFFAGGAIATLDPVAEGDFYNSKTGGSGGRGIATGESTVYEDSVSGKLVIKVTENTSFSPAFTVEGWGTDLPSNASDTLVIFKAFLDKPAGRELVPLDASTVDVTQIPGPALEGRDWQQDHDQDGANFWFNTTLKAKLEVSMEFKPIAVADKDHPLEVNTRVIVGSAARNVFHDIPSAALKGQVKDGGSPVAGVEVKLSNATLNYTATTDSGGNYEIKDIFVGDYTLESGTCSKEKSMSLTVGGGWTTQNLDLVARSLDTVSGYVTKDDLPPGPPYPPLFHAIVSNYCTTASDLTDSSGFYSLQMPIGVEITVKAAKWGYVSQFQPATAPESDVNFILPQDCPFCPNGPSQG